jgi:hypothetical protein
MSSGLQQFAEEPVDPEGDVVSDRPHLLKRLVGWAAVSCS